MTSIQADCKAASIQAADAPAAQGAAAISGRGTLAAVLQVKPNASLDGLMRLSSSRLGSVCSGICFWTDAGLSKAWKHLHLLASGMRPYCTLVALPDSMVVNFSSPYPRHALTTAFELNVCNIGF